MCDSVTGVSWGHGLPLLVSPLPIGKIQLFTFVVDHVPISLDWKNSSTLNGWWLKNVKELISHHELTGSRQAFWLLLFLGRWTRQVETWRCTHGLSDDHRDPPRVIEICWMEVYSSHACQCGLNHDLTCFSQQIPAPSNRYCWIFHHDLGTDQTPSQALRPPALPGRTKLSQCHQV